MNDKKQPKRETIKHCFNDLAFRDNHFKEELASFTPGMTV